MREGRVRPDSAFTLIELVLYVTIVAIISTGMIYYAWNIVGSGAKSGTQQEVYTQARYLSERIKKEVRDSNGITTCNGTTITLSNANAALNPTTISFASNQITIAQGSPPPTAVRIHSQDTLVTSFNCISYTSADNKTKNLQFTFTMTDNFASSRQEYLESINIQSSAEVRNN